MVAVSLNIWGQAAERAGLQGINSTTEFRRPVSPSTKWERCIYSEPASPSTLSACLWGCFMAAARGAGTHKTGGKRDVKWALPGIFTPRCQEEPTSILSTYWSWAETYTVRKMGASRLGLGLSVCEHPRCLEAQKTFLLFLSLLQLR